MWGWQFRDNKFVQSRLPDKLFEIAQCTIFKLILTSGDVQWMTSGSSLTDEQPLKDDPEQMRARKKKSD